MFMLFAVLACDMLSEVSSAHKASQEPHGLMPISEPRTHQYGGLIPWLLHSFKASWARAHPPNLDAVKRVKTLSRGSRVKTLPDTTIRVKTLSLRRLG